MPAFDPWPNLLYQIGEPTISRSSDCKRLGYKHLGSVVPQSTAMRQDSRGRRQKGAPIL